MRFIVIVLACLRLWVRLRLHRLWWEDAWAFLALCLDVICAVTTWTLNLPERAFCYSPLSLESRNTFFLLLNFAGDHPWIMSRGSHIISIWLTLLSYACLIWCVLSRSIPVNLNVNCLGRPE